MRVLPQGTFTPLVHAHAGRTQFACTRPMSYNRGEQSQSVAGDATRYDAQVISEGASRKRSVE
jgi:hypothetical protein